MSANPNVRKIISFIRKIRIDSGTSTDQIETELNLGKGWVLALEDGIIEPPFDLVLSIIEYLNINFNDIIKKIEFEKGQSLSRKVSAIEKAGDLQFHFKYNDYNAKYIIKNASAQQYDDLLRQFQNDVNGNKSGAIVNLFFTSLEKWPSANPSDIWYFLTSRIYQDPYNHPASEIHRDFGQSWKRASGWALEKIFVELYRSELRKNDILIDIFKEDETEKLLSKLNLNYHVEPNKADVLLVNIRDGAYDCFGVAHIKASIAERRQNDQNFSQALLNKNYFSPFLTMDCKAFPAEFPVNKGELGVSYDITDDQRSDKRKEFEEEGYFSGCFSLNYNTIPTPPGQKAASRIYRLDIRNRDDEFVAMAIRKRNQLYS
jgi:transcriptional regulator with XRE-family HTH domain